MSAGAREVQANIGPWRIRLELTHVCAYRGCEAVATDRFRGAHLCRGHLWSAMQNVQGRVA